MANVATRWPRGKAYPVGDALLREDAAHSALRFSATPSKTESVSFMLMKNFLYWGSCLMMISLIILAMQRLLA